MISYPHHEVIRKTLRQRMQASDEVERLLPGRLLPVNPLALEV